MSEIGFITNLALPIHVDKPGMQGQLLAGRRKRDCEDL